MTDICTECGEHCEYLTEDNDDGTETIEISDCCGAVMPIFD